jgi:hypothetical protein
MHGRVSVQNVVKTCLRVIWTVDHCLPNPANILQCATHQMTASAVGMLKCFHPLLRCYGKEFYCAYPCETHEKNLLWTRYQLTLKKRNVTTNMRCATNQFSNLINNYTYTVRREFMDRRTALSLPLSFSQLQQCFENHHMTLM